MNRYFLPIGIISALILTIILLPNRSNTISPVEGDYVTKGKIVPKGTYYSVKDFLYSNVKSWGSWTKDKGDANQGMIQTPWFKQNSNDHLYFSFSGFPTNCALRIQIQGVNGDTTYKIDYNAHEIWKEVRIRATKGDKVRIIMEDNSTASACWVAFTEPYTKNLLSYSSIEKKTLLGILNIILCFIYFLFFLIVGIVCFEKVKLSLPNFLSSPSLYLLTSFTLACLISYFVAMLYFANNILGIVISCLVVPGATFLFIKKLLRDTEFKKYITNREFLLPIVMIFIIGLLYLTNGSIHRDVMNTTLEYFNGRFNAGLPTDNFISFSFMNFLFDGKPLNTPEFFGEWHSSDRPPLYGSMLLLLRPFSIFNPFFYYQVLGTFLQLSWLLGVFALFDYWKIKKGIQQFILGLTVFSGTFILNSVFLWPKLIVIPVFVLLFIIIQKMISLNKAILKQNYFIFLLFAWAVVACMLFHGGSVFALIPLFLFFGIPLIKNISYRQFFVLLIAILALYLPWIMYQKFYDPPGDRLLRWHLANDLIPFEESGKSLLEVLKHYYSQFTLSSWFNTKIGVFKSVYYPLWSHFFSMNFQSHYAAVFFRLPNAFFFIYPAIIIYIIMSIKHLIHKGKNYVNNNRKIIYLSALIALTILTHLSLTISPVIHQSSYAYLIFIVFLIGFFMYNVNGYILKVIFYLFVLYFLYFWTYDFRAFPPVYSFLNVAVGLVALSTFIYLTHKKLVNYK